jgi:predicted ATP-dependent endonuclease of OLD family
MKLKKARVQNFRSIEDTTEFEINELTCLVGKNEAGKTAVLQAIEAQRPYSKASATYDVTKEYPRRFVTQFEQRHPDEEAVVCTTTWQLTEKDNTTLAAEFGNEFITNDVVEITSGYGFDGTRWSLSVDEKKGIEYLLSKFKLDASERNALNKAAKGKELYDILKPLQRTEKQEALFQQISKYRDQSIQLKAIDILYATTPKFIYISHYDRMAGQIAVEHLIQQRKSGTTSKEDEIFLSLLNLAGTSLDDLKDSTRYEELKAKCEAASNSITEKIFQYWSQNDALEVQIEFSQGRSEDTPPFNSGTVVRARVWNGHHRASVPFSERSAGFVWFFSFLVKFAEIRNNMGNVIILLDEPGLTLHGKAQSDLLKYIERELLPYHQVIFSTHSPFLVPAHRLADVRIVEDLLEYKKGQNRPIVHGTKVLKDILETDKDTLFPLQGAMGYDICQSLFVGRQTILVEGPSDILYLQALSSALKRKGRTSLDPRWTLCPSGGIDKMQSFISLFAGNHLDVAVLTDQGSGEKAKIERLKRSEILRAGWVYSIADFVGQEEADVEDVFEPSVYADILNSSFGLSSKDKLDASKLGNADTSTKRLLKKTEAAFRVMSEKAPNFDHFTPSEWLLRNPGFLDEKSDAIEKTLSQAEEIIKAFNNLLQKI